MINYMLENSKKEVVGETKRKSDIRLMAIVYLAHHTSEVVYASKFENHVFINVVDTFYGRNYWGF